MQIDPPRRWPAVLLALLLLGYAAGKAAYAAQARLGFPGGPRVSAAEQATYARQMMDPALAQWCATATGLVAALLVLVTVTPARRLPRWLVWPLLAGVVLGIGAGAGVMVWDAFGGRGPGWGWPFGLLGAATLGLLGATTHSYAQATSSKRRRR